MTANEMREKFLQKLDVITNYSTPGLEDEEIGTFLTDAEFNFVKNALPPKNMVDATEMLRSELGTLYETTSLSASSTQTDVDENGKFWDLPDNCLYVFRCSPIMASDTSCLNGRRIKCKSISHSEFDNIDNPFKRPGRGLVWVLQGKVDPTGIIRRLQTIISTDYTGITTFNVTYLKKPGGIVPNVTTPGSAVNSILPSTTHQEIVDNAVEQAKLQLGLLNEYQAQNMYNEENK